MTLVGMIAAMYGGGYVFDSLLGQRLAASSGPQFKVKYGDSVEERDTQCGRNLCPTEQVAVRRLTIQSLNEQPVVVKNVVVNDNEECTANPLAKLADALKAEGRDVGMLAQLAAKSAVATTMKYGDVANVPLYGCQPIRVRVLTDRGESVYLFE